MEHSREEVTYFDYLPIDLSTKPPIDNTRGTVCSAIAVGTGKSPNSTGEKLRVYAIAKSDSMKMEI